MDTDKNTELLKSNSEDNFVDIALETDSVELLGTRKENDTGKSTIIVISLILIVIISMIAIFMSIYNNSSSNESQTFNPTTNQCVNDRYLILISMDGFRHDYLTNNEWRTKYNVTTPNIDQLINNGVYIKNVAPVYPSLTFPNHLSIVTGLYPGYHGIVANSFYDPVYQQWFGMSTIDNTGKWYRGEPIWQTMKNNINKEKFKEYGYKKSGTTMWVGTEANISGNGYPDNYISYDYNMPYLDRINRTISLLNTTEYRLLILYFEQPDSNGHTYGPDSNQVASVVMEMDNYLGILVDKIKKLENNFWSKTDIMLVSDHGMTTVLNETILIHNTTNFDLRNDNNNFIVEYIGANLLVTLTENSQYTVQQTIDLIKENTTPNDKYQIWSKNDIPYNYKESYNNRIADIIVSADIGYFFEYSYIDRSNQGWLNQKGSHGWNNSELDMNSILVGHGPSFKQNYIKNTANNIDFYELLCQLLCGLTPAPNNGSLDKIQDILDINY